MLNEYNREFSKVMWSLGPPGRRDLEHALQTAATTARRRSLGPHHLGRVPGKD